MRKEGKHWNKIRAELSLTSCKIEESVLRISVLSLAVLIEKCLKQKSLFVGKGRQPTVCDRAASGASVGGGAGGRFCCAQSTQSQWAAPRAAGACWVPMLGTQPGSH